MERLLVIGLDELEYRELRVRAGVPMVYRDLAPRIFVDQGRLFVESANAFGAWTEVTRVIFHGIFEDDYALIGGLALWGGPCLPNAIGMMECRLRVPCLVRALGVSRFSAPQRGFISAGAAVDLPGDRVAKWGEWHCGENKERVSGNWTADAASLVEPYLPGSSVRVHLLGEKPWQLQMGGADWKQSIHDSSAKLVPLDEELVADARALQRHFGLEMLAVDYQVTADGTKHLLEVNHIPNVTLFSELREAYLEYAARWARGN
jgi:hypothetical protein